MKICFFLQNIEPWLKANLKDFEEIMAEKKRIEGLYKVGRVQDDEEFQDKGTLKFSQNILRKIVRLICTGIRELFGTHPHRDVYKATGESIVSFFPFLKNDENILGYVSYLF